MDLSLGLQITLIGVMGVFTTLLVLLGVVQIPHLFFKLTEARKQEVKIEPRASEGSPGIPTEHLAVIGAAVAMMGTRYRISAIEVTINENWERCRYTENITL